MPTKREPLYVVEVKTGTRPVRWERCSGPMSRRTATAYAAQWMRDNPQWVYRQRPWTPQKASDAD